MPHLCQGDLDLSAGVHDRACHCESQLHMHGTWKLRVAAGLRPTNRAMCSKGVFDKLCTDGRTPSSGDRKGHSCSPTTLSFVPLMKTAEGLWGDSSVSNPLALQSRSPEFHTHNVKSKAWRHGIRIPAALGLQKQADL